MKPGGGVTSAVRSTGVRPTVVFALLFVAAGPASGQGIPTDRFRLFVNGAAAPTATNWTGSRAYEQFGARSTLDAQYTASATAGFELGGQVRFWRRLGAAASFSNIDRKGSAEVRTRLPLPAILGGGADVSTESGGFPLKEEAVHLDLVYSHRLRELELGVFAGVTRTSVEVGLVDSLAMSLSFSPEPERPPQVSAVTAIPRSFSASATGINVGGGLDLVLGTFGMGAQLRYSRSTANLDAGSVEIRLGGLQLAVGLRVFF